MPRKPRLSWEIKAQILDYASVLGKDDLIGIQRSMDDWLRKRPEENLETAPDTRTIRRIIEEELPNISPEAVIEKLPKRVWKLRSDCEELERLAGSYLSDPATVAESVLSNAGMAENEDLEFDRNKFMASEKIMNRLTAMPAGCGSLKKG